MAVELGEGIVKVEPGRDVTSAPRLQLSTRVLVITQNEQVCEALHSVLEQTAVPMSVLRDERAGWRALLRLRPKMAVIDLGPRSKSGFPLCERIRRRAELRGMFLLLCDDGSQADEPCTMGALQGPDAVVSGPHAHELLASIAAGVLDVIA